MTNPLNGYTKQIFMRLLEASTIGGVILFGIVQTIGNDLKHLKQDYEQVREDIREIRDDFYVPRFERADRKN